MRLRHLLSLSALALLSAALAAQPPSLVERLGYPAGTRLLIVHADDVGMCHAENAASIAALEDGTITSASIMVPCPWFAHFAAWARRHPEADLGVHLTLTSEWAHYRWGPVLPAAQVPSLVDSSGFFHRSNEAVARHARPEEVLRELTAQIERARAAGIRLTHLDTHMGTLFQSPGLLEVYLELGRRYQLPVLLPREQIRERAPELLLQLERRKGILLIDRILMAYPEALPQGVPTADFYEEKLRHLPPGVSELIVHLAHDTPEMREIATRHPHYGASWRQADVDFVFSARFREILKEEGIVLIDWQTLQALWYR